MSNNLVFVCGALRSGSSLTHLMLDNHPNIKNPGEFDFLFDQISDEGEFPDIIQYKDWLSWHRIFQSKHLYIEKQLEFAALIQSFISQLSQPDSILALNIHRGFDRVPFLFQNAKFIHLIRDPRDVARSSIGMGWAGNVYYGVEHWIKTERSWERLRNKILPNQILEISYEDLIVSPETTLRDVCSFMEIEYSRMMLDYTEGSTYSKPDPSLTFQWHKKLSIREIRLVESRAHDLMKQLGYQLSGYPLLSIGKLEKFWLSIANRFYRVNFAVRRYGPALYFKEWFSRYFGMISVNKRSRVKMNIIEKRHLK